MEVHPTARARVTSRGMKEMVEDNSHIPVSGNERDERFAELNMSRENQILMEHLESRREKISAEAGEKEALAKRFFLELQNQLYLIQRELRIKEIAFRELSKSVRRLIGTKDNQIKQLHNEKEAMLAELYDRENAEQTSLKEDTGSRNTVVEKLQSQMCIAMREMENKDRIIQQQQFKFQVKDETLLKVQTLLDEKEEEITALKESLCIQVEACKRSLSKKEKAWKQASRRGEQLDDLWKIREQMYQEEHMKMMSENRQLQYKLEQTQEELRTKNILFDEHSKMMSLKAQELQRLIATRDSQIEQLQTEREVSFMSKGGQQAGPMKEDNKLESSGVEKKAMAKNEQLQNELDFTEEELKAKTKDETILRLQKHLEEKEVEITALKENLCLQIENYKRSLSEKDKASQEEIEQLEEQWKMYEQMYQEEYEKMASDSSQKATLITEDDTPKVEKEKWGKEIQGLARENEALAKKNEQLQNELDLIQADLRTKADKFLTKDETLLQVQKVLGEKEEEITILKESLCIQMDDKKSLSEKVKARKKEIEQLEGEWKIKEQVYQEEHKKMIRETLKIITEENRQNTQEELNTKEIICLMEEEKWVKERDAIAGERDYTAKKNEELQNEVDLLQDELRTREDEFHTTLLENKALAQKNVQLRNELDLTQDELRTKTDECHTKDQNLLQNEALAHKNEQLQNELDLIQDELRTKADEFSKNNETLLQVQWVLREKEEEITTLKESISIQMDDYNGKLSEKDKACKVEIEQLEDQLKIREQRYQEEHKMNSDSSQKETLIPEENIQEDVKTKDNTIQTKDKNLQKVKQLLEEKEEEMAALKENLCVQLEDYSRRLSEKDKALQDEIEHLEGQLKIREQIYQEEHKTISDNSQKEELISGRNNNTDKGKWVQDMRQGLAREKKALAKTNELLLNKLDLIQEELRTTKKDDTLLQVQKLLDEKEEEITALQKNICIEMENKRSLSKKEKAHKREIEQLKGQWKRKEQMYQEKHKKIMSDNFQKQTEEENKHNMEKEKWEEEKLGLAREKEALAALAERNEQLHNKVDLIQQELRTNEDNFQRKDETLLQVQELLKEKNEEITALKQKLFTQVVAYKKTLSEKEKASQEEFEKLEDQWDIREKMFQDEHEKMISDSSDKETVIREEARQLKHKLDLIQKELRTKEEKFQTNYKSLVQVQKLLKEKEEEINALNKRQSEKDTASEEEIQQLERQWKIKEQMYQEVHKKMISDNNAQNEILITMENNRTMEKDKWEAERQGLAREKEVLANMNEQLENQLDILQGELRTKESLCLMDKERWEAEREEQASEKDAAAKKNEQLQKQLDLIQEELRAKEHTFQIQASEKDAAAKKNEQLQNQLDLLQEQLRAKEHTFQIQASEKDAVAKKNEQLQNQLDLIQEQLRAKEHTFQIQASEKDAAAKKNEQLQNQLDLIQEEQRAKEHTFQIKDETLSKVQKLLEEKVVEITTLKEDYKRNLSEKDKGWKEAIEKLKGQWKIREQVYQEEHKKIISDSSQKESLIRQETRQLKYKLNLIQEELKTKENNFLMEKGKWGRERQGLTGEKEALAKKNVQLQNKLDLIQDELRTKTKDEILLHAQKLLEEEITTLKENLRLQMEDYNRSLSEKDKASQDEIEHLQGQWKIREKMYQDEHTQWITDSSQKETLLAEENRQLTYKLDHIQEELRTKETLYLMEEEKWGEERQGLVREKESLSKKNEQLQGELRTKEHSVRTKDETLLQVQKRLQMKEEDITALKENLHSQTKDYKRSHSEKDKSSQEKIEQLEEQWKIREQMYQEEHKKMIRDSSQKEKLMREEGRQFKYKLDLIQEELRTKETICLMDKEKWGRERHGLVGEKEALAKKNEQLKTKLELIQKELRRNTTDETLLHLQKLLDEKEEEITALEEKLLAWKVEIEQLEGQWKIKEQMYQEQHKLITDSSQKETLIAEENRIEKEKWAEERRGHAGEKEALAMKNDQLQTELEELGAKRHEIHAKDETLLQVQKLLEEKEKEITILNENIVILTGGYKRTLSEKDKALHNKIEQLEGQWKIKEQMYQEQHKKMISDNSKRESDIREDARQLKYKVDLLQEELRTKETVSLMEKGKWGRDRQGLVREKEALAKKNEQIQNKLDLIQEELRIKTKDETLLHVQKMLEEEISTLNDNLCIQMEDYKRTMSEKEEEIERLEGQWKIREQMYQDEHTKWITDSSQNETLFTEENRQLKYKLDNLQEELRTKEIICLKKEEEWVKERQELEEESLVKKNEQLQNHLNLIQEDLRTKEHEFQTKSETLLQVQTLFDEKEKEIAILKQNLSILTKGYKRTLSEKDKAMQKAIEQLEGEWEIKEQMYQEDHKKMTSDNSSQKELLAEITHNMEEKWEELKTKESIYLTEKAEWEKERQGLETTFQELKTTTNNETLRVQKLLKEKEEEIITLKENLFIQMEHYKRSLTEKDKESLQEEIEQLEGQWKLREQMYQEDHEKVISDITQKETLIREEAGRLKYELDLVQKELRTKESIYLREKEKWDQDSQGLAGERDALARKYERLQNQLDLLQEELNNETLQIQELLEEKEEEIASLKENLCIQMENYQRSLSEKAKSSQEEIEQLKGQLKVGEQMYQEDHKKVISDSSQKETAIREEARQLKYDIDLIQKEVTAKETIYLKEKAKWEKVRMGLAVDNEALAKKNENLQHHLDLIQEELRTNTKDETLLRVQKLLEEEVTALKENVRIQMEDYKRNLSEKEEEIEQLEGQWKITEQMYQDEHKIIISDSSQNETLITEENRQLNYKLGHIQEELRTKESLYVMEQEKWVKERQGLAGEKEALVKKNAQLQNHLEFIQEELRTKDCKFQKKYETLLQAQDLLEEKEEEIDTLKESISVQTEDYNRRLSEKDKAWKVQIGQLEDKWKIREQMYQEEHKKMISDNTQKETQNRRIMYKLDHMQEELRSKEALRLIEEEKWGKERQGLVGEKETLAYKNEQLQNQLDLIQEDLRTKETRWSLSFSLEREKWSKERLELAEDKDSLTTMTGQLQKQLHRVQEEVRAKDTHQIMEKEKWDEEIQRLAGEKEALAKKNEKNEQLQNQLDLVQEELKTKETNHYTEKDKWDEERQGLVGEKEALANKSEQLQNQLDIIQRELRNKESRWSLAFSLEREKWMKERQELVGDKENVATMNGQLHNQLRLIQDDQCIEKEKWWEERQGLTREKEALAKKNEQMQKQMDLVQREQRTKETRLAGEKEALANSNEQLQNQLHFIEEELTTQENRWHQTFNLEREKWQKLATEKNLQLKSQLNYISNELIIKEKELSQLSHSTSIHAEDLCQNIRNIYPQHCCEQTRG